ncbi:MAG: tripartite tricarboxylate transporter substrate binding protein [Pseudomonadota bacterium]
MKFELSTLRRRTLLALLATAAGAASAQSRDKPITLCVGYPPGGGTDYVARLLAQRMSTLLDQQVIVLNLPGATGMIALERVAKSAPDGNTLVLMASGDTILPALRTNLPVDLRRDLAFVAPVVRGPLALVVNPALPVKSVADLVALAKAKPGVLNFGSPGVGNAQHLAGEAFDRAAGVKMVHVPFKGGAEATNGIISGDVQVGYLSIAPAMPLVQAGKLRLLAVTTKARSAAAPDTPTIAELGFPGYDVSSWFGVAARAGTPRDVLLKLNDIITRALQGPEAKEALLKQGLEQMIETPDQFTATVQAAITHNAALARDIGLKAE